MKRVLKRVAFYLGVLLLLVAVVVGCGYLWLSSEAGESFIKNEAMNAINDSLEGSVQFAQLSREGETITLKGVKLFTPEGELVAEVPLLTAELEFGALIHREVKISSLTIDSPSVNLVSDQRGLNLSRAIAAKKSAAPSSGGSPTALSWNVEKFTVSKGAFAFTSESQKVKTSGIALEGTVTGQTPPFKILATTTLHGQLESPERAPFAGTLSAELDDGKGFADAAISLGKSRVAVRYDVAAQSAKVASLLADPEDVKAFVEQWPLKVPVSLQGTVSETLIDATVNADKSKVVISLKPTLGTRSAVTVRGENVDLQELLGTELESVLDVAVTGEFEGRTVDQLNGALAVKATLSDTAKHSLLQADGTVEAAAGIFSTKQLQLKTVGATAVVSGKYGQGKVVAGADLQLVDASATARALKSYLGVDVGPVKGHGTLHAEANGPISDLGVSVTGSLKDLARNDLSAQLVTLNLRMPDIRKPLNVDGTVEVKQFNFSGRKLESISAQVAILGRDINVTLKTVGLGDLRLSLGAYLNAGMTSAEVKTLTLQSTRALWQLDAPTSVTWADQQIHIDPTSLSSGTQRISFNVTQGKRVLTGQLQLNDLQLETLPELLLPVDAHARGLVGGTISFSGVWPSTSITSDLTWKHGSLMGVEDISMNLGAAVQNEVLTVKFDADSSLAVISGTGSMPLSADADSLDATVSVKRVSAEALAKLLKRELPIAPKGLEATLIASGKRSAPNLELVATAEQLLVPVKDQQLALDSVRASVKSVALGKPDISVSLTTMGGTVQLTATPDLTLESLKTHRPTVEELQQLTATAHAEVHSLNLANFYTLKLVDHDDITGLFSATVDASGSLDKQTVDATAELVKSGYGTVTDASINLVVKSSPVDSTATVGLALKGRPLGTIDFHLRDGLSALRNVEKLGPQPLILRAQLNDFDLKDVVPQHVEDGAMTSGHVTLTAALEGTFDHPTLALNSTIENLQFSKLPLGKAVIVVTGDASTQNFEVRLGSKTHEDFSLKGNTDLHLGLADVRKGMDVTNAKIAAAFTSKNFEIGFLSGVHPLVRLVGGSLSANGTISGTLGDPQILADVELHKGKIALQGNGEYRDIELKASLTSDALTLSQLNVHSGAGTATMTGSAKRQQAGGYHFQFSGMTDHFPVVNDDQLMATTSLRELELEGTFSDSLLDVQKLAVSRVDVELPDLKRKDLQDLQRPTDVVVVHKGKLSSRDKEALAAKKAATTKGRTYRAVFDIPRNIWIKSSDIELEAGLSDFRVEYDSTVAMFGRATVLRGKISVVGRQFEIAPDSQVNFAGAPTQPYINVTAIHVNDREKVKVTVNVTGRGKDVKFVVSSNPSMPESDIYTLLATGRRELRKSASASISPEQALSVIGSLAANQLKSVFAAKLPFDVLSFETGSDDNKSARLELGTYLTDSIYLGYQWQPYANQARGENTHAGRVEIQLSKQWTAEATAGTAPAAGADFVWSIDY